MQISLSVMTQRKVQQRNSPSRLEKDEAGEINLPTDVYYGVKTQRLMQQLPAFGQRVNQRLVEGLAHTKKAVLQAAFSEKLFGSDLDSETEISLSKALFQACDELIEGEFAEDIIVDGLSGACGHALNTNLNEIISNRAGELLGDPLGSYQKVDPEKHANINQTLSDLYLTAMRVAVLLGLKQLKSILLDLERTLRRKSLEFESIIKLGRINYNDAAPVTLGQEFNAYGSSIERALKRLTEASSCLKEVNLGGALVGTGFGVSTGFQMQVLQNLSNGTRLDLRAADDYIRVTSSMSDFLEFSAGLRELACDLAKMASDLAFMASGPYGGVGEISLPSGFANEELLVAAYQSMANDQAVLIAGQAGRLEASIFTPLIIHNILSSMQILEAAIAGFTHECLSKVKADSARCRSLLENSEALLPVLVGELGLQKSREVLNRAREQNKEVKEILQEDNLLPKETLDRLFHYKYMTSAQR